MKDLELFIRIGNAQADKRQAWLQELAPRVHELLGRAGADS